MSLISIRKLTPTVGKSALAAERAHALGGIYARHGAKARVGRVIAGAGAGQIYLGIGFEDGKSMGQIFEKVQADPSESPHFCSSRATSLPGAIQSTCPDRRRRTATGRHSTSTALGS